MTPAIHITVDMRRIYGPALIRTARDALLALHTLGRTRLGVALLDPVGSLGTVSSGTEHVPQKADQLGAANDPPAAPVVADNAP